MSLEVKLPDTLITLPKELHTRAQDYLTSLQTFTNSTTLDSSGPYRSGGEHDAPANDDKAQEWR